MPETRSIRLPARPSRSALIDRDAAGHRRLEFERDAFASAGAASAAPCIGEQRLVGGDHSLPARERRLDRRLGGAVGAADQLDEDVDIGARGQRDRIVEPAMPRESTPRSRVRRARDRRDD